jgi:hypothetical protein
MIHDLNKFPHYLIINILFNAEDYLDKFKKFRPLLKLFTLLTLLVVLFQNCSGGFSTLKNTTTGDLASSANILPDNDAGTGASPVISPPNGEITGSVRLSLKIPVPVTDTDSTSEQITYVIRQMPQSGTLVVDGPEVLQNRGVTYTPPNSYFTGTVAFTLAAVDSDGNTSADQIFRVRIEPTGPGLVMGTWSQERCVPNTAPRIVTYQLGANRFNYSEWVYTNDCRGLLYQVFIRGNYTIGRTNLITQDGRIGHEMNATNYSLIIRVTEPQAAIDMNNSRFCGYNNWVVGELKEISSTGCSGVWRGPQVYTAERVEFPQGANPARLYLTSLSSAGNGNTPQTRSTLLSNNFLVKTSESFPDGF